LMVLEQRFACTVVELRTNIKNRLSELKMRLFMVNSPG